MSRTTRSLAGGAAAVVHFEQSQEGAGRVPVLAHRGLDAFDAVPLDFPIGVQPEGIAHHDDDPLFDRGLVLGLAVSEARFLKRSSLSRICVRCR